MLTDFRQGFSPAASIARITRIPGAFAWRGHAERLPTLRCIGRHFELFPNLRLACLLASIPSTRRSIARGVKTMPP
jgi:hypothetical protein